MSAALLIVGAFLLGSVPFGLVVGRIWRGVDVRQHGSGNIGFTNVYRVVGPGPGFVVLALDLAKGAAAVLAARAFFPSPQTDAAHGWVVVGCAFAVIAGHNWSVFLGLKGGKGVAAGAGALLAFVPELFLVLLLVWGVVLGTTRYVSLASVSASALFPVLVLLVYPRNIPYLAFAVVGAAAVVFQHRGNIGRLIAGTERRVGEGRDSPDSPPAASRPAAPATPAAKERRR